MGNRDDIDELPSGNASVLTTALKLIDKYDLYGSVAYPKHHKQSDVPDIYRLAANTKGVFINPALVEPFGLTLIEVKSLIKYNYPIFITFSLTKSVKKYRPRLTGFPWWPPRMEDRSIYFR